jgi:hypothetical protein
MDTKKREIRETGADSDDANFAKVFGDWFLDLGISLGLGVWFLVFI